MNRRPFTVVWDISAFTLWMLSYIFTCGLNNLDFFDTCICTLVIVSPKMNLNRHLNLYGNLQNVWIQEIWIRSQVSVFIGFQTELECAFSGNFLNFQCECMFCLCHLSTGKVLVNFHFYHFLTPFLTLVLQFFFFFLTRDVKSFTL